MFIIKIIGTGMLFLALTVANAATPDDIFIAGYSAAVIKQNFNLDISGLTVKIAVIFIPSDSLPEAGQDCVKTQETLDLVP
jgi:hypothetical protein